MTDPKALVDMIMQLANSSQNTALIGTDMFGNQIIRDYGQGSVVGNLLLQSRGNMGGLANNIARESDNAELINNLTQLMLNARGVIGPITPEIENNIRAQAANIAPALPMIANTMRSMGMDTGTIDNIIRSLYGSKGSVQHLYGSMIPTLAPYVGTGVASNIATTLVSSQYGEFYNPYRLSGVSASDMADTLQFMSQSGQLRANLFKKGSGFGLSGMGNLARNLGRLGVDEVEREDAFREFWDDEAIHQAGARYAAEVRAMGGSMDIDAYLTEDERKAYAFEDLINEQLNNIKQDTNVDIHFNKDAINLDEAISDLNKQFAEHITKAQNRGDERAKKALENYKESMIDFAKQMYNKKDLRDNRGNIVSVSQLLRLRSGREAEAGARYVEEEVEDMQKELAYIEEKREAALKIKDHDERKKALEEVQVEEAIFKGKAQSTALGRAAYSVLDTTDVMSNAVGTARMAGVIRAAYAREGEQVTQAQALAATKAIAGGSLAGIDTKQLARDIDAAMTSYNRGGGKTTEFLRHADYAQSLATQIGISKEAATAIAMNSARDREYLVKAGMSQEEAGAKAQENARRLEMFRSMEPVQYLYIARNAMREMNEDRFRELIQDMPYEQQVAWRKVRAGNLNSRGMLTRQQLFDLTGLLRPGLEDIYVGPNGEFDPYVFSDLTRNKNNQAAVENDPWLQTNLENMANQEQLRRAESTLNRQMPNLPFGSTQMLNAENVLFANAVEISNFLKGSAGVNVGDGSFLGIGGATEEDRKRAIVDRYVKFAKQLQEQFILGGSPEMADRLGVYISHLQNDDGSLNLDGDIAPLRAFIAGLDTARTEAYATPEEAAGRFSASQNKAFDRQADEYLAGLKEESTKYADVLTRIESADFKNKSPEDQRSALAGIMQQVFNIKNTPLNSIGKARVTDALILSQYVPTDFVKNNQAYHIDIQSLSLARRMLPVARVAKWAALDPAEAESTPSGFRDPVTGRELNILEARQLLQRVQDYTLAWSGLDTFDEGQYDHPLQSVDQFNPEYYYDNRYGQLLENEEKNRVKAVRADANRLLGLTQDDKGKWVENTEREKGYVVPKDYALSGAYATPEVADFMKPFIEAEKEELREMSKEVPTVLTDADRMLIPAMLAVVKPSHQNYKYVEEYHEINNEIQALVEKNKAYGTDKTFTKEEYERNKQRLVELQEKRRAALLRAIARSEGQSFSYTTSVDGTDYTTSGIVSLEPDSVGYNALKAMEHVESGNLVRGFTTDRLAYLDILTSSSGAVTTRKNAAKKRVEALKNEGATKEEFMNYETGATEERTRYTARAMYNAKMEEQVLSGVLTDHPTLDYALETNQEGVQLMLTKARQVVAELTPLGTKRTPEQKQQLEAAERFLQAADEAAVRVAEKKRVTEMHARTVAEYMPLFSMSPTSVTESKEKADKYSTAIATAKSKGETTIVDPYNNETISLTEAQKRENEARLASVNYTNLFRDNTTNEQNFGTLYGQYLTSMRHAFMYNLTDEEKEIREAYERGRKVDPNSEFGATYDHEEFVRDLAELNKLKEMSNSELSDLDLDTATDTQRALMLKFNAQNGHELKARLGFYLNTAYKPDPEKKDSEGNAQMMRRYDEIGLIGTKTAHETYLDLIEQRKRIVANQGDTTEIDTRLRQYESTLANYAKVYSREFEWYTSLSRSNAELSKAEEYDKLVAEARKEGLTTIVDPVTGMAITLEAATKRAEGARNRANEYKEKSETQYAAAEEFNRNMEVQRRRRENARVLASLNLNPETLEEKFDAMRKDALSDALDGMDAEDPETTERRNYIEGKIAWHKKRQAEYDSKSIHFKNLAEKEKDPAKRAEYIRLAKHYKGLANDRTDYIERYQDALQRYDKTYESDDYSLLLSEIKAVKADPRYKDYTDEQVLQVVGQRLNAKIVDARKNIDAGRQRDLNRDIVRRYSRASKILDQLDPNLHVGAPRMDVEAKAEIDAFELEQASQKAAAAASSYKPSEAAARALFDAMNVGDRLLAPDASGAYHYTVAESGTPGEYTITTDIGDEYVVKAVAVPGSSGVKVGKLYVNKSTTGTPHYEEVKPLEAAPVTHEESTPPSETAAAPGTVPVETPAEVPAAGPTPAPTQEEEILAKLKEAGISTEGYEKESDAGNTVISVGGTRYKLMSGNLRKQTEAGTWDLVVKPAGPAPAPEVASAESTPATPEATTAASTPEATATAPGAESVELEPLDLTELPAIDFEGTATTETPAETAAVPGTTTTETPAEVPTEAPKPSEPASGTTAPTEAVPAEATATPAEAVPAEATATPAEAPATVATAPAAEAVEQTESAAPNVEVDNSPITFGINNEEAAWYMEQYRANKIEGAVRGKAWIVGMLEQARTGRHAKDPKDLVAAIGESDLDKTVKGYEITLEDGTTREGTVLDVLRHRAATVQELKDYVNSIKDKGEDLNSQEARKRLAQFYSSIEDDNIRLRDAGVDEFATSDETTAVLPDVMLPSVNMPFEATSAGKAMARTQERVGTMLGTEPTTVALGSRSGRLTVMSHGHMRLETDEEYARRMATERASTAATTPTAGPTAPAAESLPVVKVSATALSLTPSEETVSQGELDYSLVPDNTDAGGYSPVTGAYNVEEGQPTVPGDLEAGSAVELLDVSKSAATASLEATGTSTRTSATTELLKPTAAKDDKVELLTSIKNRMDSIYELVHKHYDD